MQIFKNIKLKFNNFIRITKLIETNFFWLVLPKCADLGENIEFPSPILLVRTSNLIFPTKIYNTLVLKAAYTNNFLFFDYKTENKINDGNSNFIFILKQNKSSTEKDYEIKLQY